MSVLKSISIFLIAFILFSCETKNTKKDKVTQPSLEKIELTKSQKIINKTIVAHGGDLYTSAHYSFVFRNNKYTFKNDGASYEYTKNTKKGKSIINDVLTNSGLQRTVDGVPKNISEKEKNSISGAINSVIYFATLPYKLNDEAVNSEYIGSTLIKNKEYDVLKISFDKVGGGEDHDDEYCYWINKETEKIDYLAYNYSVNKGGVRFRAAYNTRVVGGITFQDYINYKAAVGTALKALPKLYEEGKLQEVSRINTEDVVNLKGNDLE